MAIFHRVPLSLEPGQDVRAPEARFPKKYRRHVDPGQYATFDHTASL